MSSFCPRLVCCALSSGWLLSYLSISALANDSGVGTQLTAEAPKKTVRAVIRVAVTRPTIWPSADNRIDLAEFDFFKRNVASMLKSPWILSRVLEDKSVQDLPLIKDHAAHLETWLADQLNVTAGNTEFVNVEMAADDPEQAKKIVNAVVGAFEREFIERDRSERLNSLDNLERKLKTFQAQLFDKRRQLFAVEQQVRNPQNNDANRIQRQIENIERLAGECVHAAMQAELQIARGEHKTKGLAESPELKSVKTEIELAEVDRDFWKQKAEVLTDQIGKLEDQRMAGRKFTGEVDQLRNEIELLQRTLENMQTTFTRMKVDLDAPFRVTILQAAGVQ